MKTRFDYSGVWITGVGEAVPVGNMETPHLLNTVRMLVQKPARTLSILVADLSTRPSLIRSGRPSTLMTASSPSRT